MGSRLDGEKHPIGRETGCCEMPQSHRKVELVANSG